MKLAMAMTFYVGFPLGMLAWACTSNPTPLNPVQIVDVGAYGADLDDCVTGSASRAQAQACMALVRQQWCGPGGRLQVQGGCSLDAGPPPQASVAPMGSTMTKWLGLDAGLDAGGDR